MGMHVEKNDVADRLSLDSRCGGNWGEMVFAGSIVRAIPAAVAATPYGLNKRPL